MAGLRCDAAEALAIGADHIDAELLRVLPAVAAAVAAPVGVAVGREGEPLAVGRPCRPEEAVGAGGIALHLFGASQVAHLAALEIEHPDVGAIAVAGRDESETRAVGREHGRILDGRAGDHRLDAGAVEARAEHIRLPGAVALRRKHHALAVGRERRVVFEHRVLQELALTGPVGIGDVEIGRRRPDPVHQHDAFFRGTDRTGNGALCHDLTLHDGCQAESRKGL